MRQQDRITEVNGSDTRGASHAEVVNLVVNSGDILDLVVIRVDDAEAERLQRIEDAGASQNKTSTGQWLICEGKFMRVD